MHSYLIHVTEDDIKAYLTKQENIKSKEEIEKRVGFFQRVINWFKRLFD